MSTCIVCVKSLRLVLCTKKRVQCSVRQMCAHQHRLMHMSLYVRICGRKTAKAGSRRPAICPLGEVQTSVQDRLHWREVLGCFLLSPSEAGLQVHCPPAAVSTLWVAPLHSGSTFHRLLFSISFQHSVSTNFYFGSFPWCSSSFHQSNKHLMILKVSNYEKVKVQNFKPSNPKVTQQ